MRYANDLDGALVYFQRSHGVYEKLGELDSVDAAYLFKNMAEIMMWSGDWRDAKAKYEQALENYSKRGQGMSPDAALILKGLGDISSRTLSHLRACFILF